jgi:hypothetical protein
MGSAATFFRLHWNTGNCSGAEKMKLPGELFPAVLLKSGYN